MHSDLMSKLGDQQTKTINPFKFPTIVRRWHCLP